MGHLQMVKCSWSWPFYMNSNSKTTPSVNLNHGILFRINQKKLPTVPIFVDFLLLRFSDLRSSVTSIEANEVSYNAALSAFDPWALGNGMAGGVRGANRVSPWKKGGGGVGFNFVLEFGGGSNIGSHPGRCNVMFFCFFLCTPFRCTSMGKQDCDFVEDFCMFTAGICGQRQVHMHAYANDNPYKHGLLVG